MVHEGTNAQEGGEDTATGTDPAATYDQPGYEDKSFGQAVDEDRGLVDDLLDETGGDQVEAERRYEQESSGAPARHDQGDIETG